MTRFARARGSKSSNERLPEAATSWNVMKQQLRDKLESSGTLTDSATSSQRIWKSSDFDKDVWNKNEVKWADLEDIEYADKAVKSEEYNKLEKKNKKKKHCKTFASEDFPPTTEDGKKKRKKRRSIDSAEFDDTQCTGIDLVTTDDNFLHTSNNEKIKKTKKNKKGADDEVRNISDINLEKQTDFDTNNTEHICLTNKQKSKRRQRADLVANEIAKDIICEENGISPEITRENNMKKKLGKKRKRSRDSISGMQDQHPAKKYESGPEGREKVNFEMSAALESSEYHLKKKHKHSKNENKIQESGCLNSVKQNFPEENTESVPVGDANVVPNEKHRKKKKFKGNRGNNAVEVVDTSLNVGKLNLQEGRGKKAKDVWQQGNSKKIMKRHDFSVEGRKIKKGKFENKYPHTTILHMNGKDIEIVKFDGFPVKKEDAENLRQLKKKMIANKIPANEIQATMKLERRKAEKALAREKKKVCFHCRKSGHVLSECPELEKADTNDLIGSGICFKCGSTEHKHFECRVTREQEFRYAKCFICNDQGHIARQCPDNPRGLYPKGGGCHVCGDVTHLKKDCPDLVKEKEEKIIKLQTLSNKALEALEDDKNAKSVSPNYVNKKRTVKF